jgi:predicted metalloprotease
MRSFLNPDLERLVEAFYRLQECEPGEERRLLANYRRLFQEAAARLPAGRSRDELQAAIRVRARQMKLARKRPPTMPPNA